MDELRLERIKINKRPEFIFQWEKAFGRKLEKSIYDWIFDENNIINVLTLDDIVVAGYCLYPFDCVINKQFGKALLCNNVFVDPIHQGKHLFVKISKLSLAESAKLKEGLIAYGIPNQLALSGHKRVGWDIRPPIHFIELNRKYSNKELPYNWKLGKLLPQQRIDIERCSILCSNERDFSIIKTKGFLKWRYESKPNIEYWFGLKYYKEKLVAYCVCKYFKEGKALHFIDIDGEDAAAISELIDESQYIPEEFNKTNIWDTTYHLSAFVSKGFQKNNKTNNLILIDPSKNQPYKIGGKINLVLGDNDVF
jgi:Acetyltransferase (GNAT) domain